MLYVIAIVNLLVGIITFAYLFAEPKPVADYLYAAILGSIVLNILSFFFCFGKVGKIIRVIKKSSQYSSYCLAITS